VLSWLRSIRRRKDIQEDRRFLEARARRLLEAYLSADDTQKKHYYEIIARAAAACQPGISDPNVEDLTLASASAAAALKVIKLREQKANEGKDHPDESITDAYAVVAIAYRRAATVYSHDRELQQLGTAAVHLVTIANSYLAAHSAET